jgi:arsenate reductase (thioredoxin)
MLPELLRQFLTAEPFMPFTLHFADGYHVEVRDPATVQWADQGPLVLLTQHKAYVGSPITTALASYLDPGTITRIITTAIPPVLVPREPEPPPTKDRILFVCTHNTARSQMAEAILRSLAGDRFEATSAGLQPGTVHPLAIQVMQEVGLDISQARTKTIFELYRAGILFTSIISVCDESREKCPVFPGVRSTLHWSIPDPVLGATPERMLEQFRSARDALYGCVREWIQAP